MDWKQDVTLQYQDGSRWMRRAGRHVNAHTGVSGAVSSALPDVGLSHHAAQRMQQRGISSGHLTQVLDYGRSVRSRGATWMVIGRKEVARYARLGIDLSDAMGVHLLLAEDGTVITTYRNHDLRKIRPSRRHGGARNPGRT